MEDANKAFDRLKVCPSDVIIGISASGNTPFTCKVLSLAKKKKILSIGIFNNQFGKLKSFCDVPILLETGKEIVEGSTRLKAGTAQKICLNLISTLLMTKFGHKKRANGFYDSIK